MELNIPHKGKMLLIDGIIDINFEEKTILSFSNIKDDNIFYDNGIDSYIFLEYAAQTAAAYNGALNNNYQNKIGFILNIKKVNCYIDKVFNNCKVYIFLKETLKDNNIAYYDSEVFTCDDEILNLNFDLNGSKIKKIIDCSIMVMEGIAMEGMVMKSDSF